MRKSFIYQNYNKLKTLKLFLHISLKRVFKEVKEGYLINILLKNKDLKLYLVQT